MKCSIEFELGTRVLLNAKASIHAGMHAKVVGTLANREAKVNGKEKTLRSYIIRLDNGGVHQALPQVLDLAPPATRGDLDTKVAWESLPAQVVSAMKKGV